MKRLGFAGRVKRQDSITTRREMLCCLFVRPFEKKGRSGTGETTRLDYYEKRNAVLPFCTPI